MNFTDKEQNNEPVINLLFQLGISYLEKGDYDNSITKFKSLIDLKPADAKGYLNLSKAYILKEQFDAEAQKIFEQALQFDPENAILNVVLSQVYLDAGREDAQALRVYQTALKHNPKNADSISAMLIKTSFQQGNIDIARELIQQFLDTPEKLISYLPLYIVNEWKHQGFDRVAQYLKSAIKIQESNLLYRWLAVNFLQAERQSLEPVELSIEDLNLCKRYLESICSFDQLLDIYLYPAIERMLVKNMKRFERTTSTALEEYEIFLAENSFSNIWERGLNQKQACQNILKLQEGSLWKKLKPWQLSEKNNDLLNVASETNEADWIDIIHNQAETLMVMKLKGITSDDVNIALSKSIATISEAETTFIGGFKTRDGFLLFWKEAACPLRSAIKFIQDHLAQNQLSSIDKSKFQFVVHKLSRSDNKTERNIVRDLQTALSFFQLEREMFFQDGHSEPLKPAGKCQLLVTSALKETMAGDGQFSFEPVELSAQHPATENDLKIYRLTWDDSLVRIRRGEITEIGHYKLLNELHHNQVFSCFKAVDAFLDRLVVVKILNPDFKINDNKDSMPQLFLHEARFLGKLSHPNIAQVYDIGIEQDFCFLAREFVEGLPLSVQRTINKKIDINRTLNIYLNIVQTLKYIHEQNIFHGRLQPNNIFVLNTHDIKITDFQISSFTIPPEYSQMPSQRHLSYLAPEQINNDKSDRLTDMFSLGTILYELVTASHPFYTEDRDKMFDNILHKTPEPPSFYNPDLPKDLDHIISKIMDKSSANRYQKMEELEKELLKLIGQ